MHIAGSIFGAGREKTKPNENIISSGSVAHLKTYGAPYLHLEMQSSRYLSYLQV